MAADGEMVSITEIEAAAELARPLDRLGSLGGRFDGFSAYRAFRWLAARRLGRR